MPYSLEILVLGQEEYVPIPEESALKVEREGGELGGLRLKNTWSIVSSMPGIWYSVIKKDEVYFSNTSLLFDTDFDLTMNAAVGDWVEDEARRACYTPFMIRAGYREDVERLLSFLLEQSPIKAAMVLPLYEQGKIETIQGPIPFCTYMRLLDEQKIPFNVCTIVKKDE